MVKSIAIKFYALQFIFDLHGIELQNSVWMLSWESIHWRIVVDNVLLRTKAVFSKAEIVERIIDFVKPEA